MSKDLIIRETYYNPEYGLTGIEELYNKLKSQGITKTQIKNFLNKQESYQLHKKPRRIHHYFPVHSSHPNELCISILPIFQIFRVPIMVLNIFYRVLMYFREKDI